jgi:hypothetical protein
MALVAYLLIGTAQCPGAGGHHGRAGSRTDWSDLCLELFLPPWSRFPPAPGKPIWVIIATIVIRQLENSLLVPRIMRKAMDVNPFVTLLSLFAISTLFGLAGVLMAIPIARPHDPRYSSSGIRP